MVRNVQKTVDVIVVGSGGTGLMAALSAAVHGADVLLLDFPWATLGSGMTAGYIAGKHAAERI